MKKVTISVASKDYTITLEDSFAESFQKDLEVYLGKKKGLDTKELLTAFVQKCYEFYETEQKNNELIAQIEENLSNY
jgi:hypothetical protein